MAAKPEERRRIIELLEVASRQNKSNKATVRSIYEAMPHLTTADLVEVFRVHREELHLETAVQVAGGRNLNFVLETLEQLGQPNLGSALRVLAARKQQGDQQAAKLLEQLSQAFLIGTMDD